MDSGNCLHRIFKNTKIASQSVLYMLTNNFREAGLRFLDQGTLPSHHASVTSTSVHLGAVLPVSWGSTQHCF